MKKIAVFLMVATALSFAGCHEAEEKTKPAITWEFEAVPDTVMPKPVYNSYKEALKKRDDSNFSHRVNYGEAEIYVFSHNGHQYLMFTVTSGCGHHGSMSASVVHDPDCPCQKVKGPGFGIRSNNEQAPGPQITL